MPASPDTGPPPSAIAPGLPGAELVRDGLSDLRAGRRSPSALLVSMSSERLRAAGIDVPTATIADAPAELHRLLERNEPAAAHAQYNALRRRLVSFCEAAEHYARRRNR